MEVGEKSRNGKESGWGESISASRLRGKENTLPTSDRGPAIVLPFMSRRAAKDGGGRRQVSVLTPLPHPLTNDKMIFA
jgi:hypothetical protein